ncbi:MAG: AAA family ATPase [Planctomycetaceae bacterium]
MLRSLEVFGFKSFADRTQFEFSKGITCVVGPNGSGKSNVVDAIKWLLGDQSAKSLRGKEMSDVIFNGSSGRKPCPYAEATLTFDNKDGFFDLDAPEVRVGRRLYASGDSEYLLNDTSVRLKDVKDVFLGTGAGTAAYSIIEQGRVDQILQANPTTRRMVFEEAAGVSRYKARRIDAEKKLEKVSQNLLRLTDIVDEVEAQLLSTRGQAQKAAKFREVSQELRHVWVGLAADDFRHAMRELAEIEATEHERVSQLTALATEIAHVEERKSAVDGDLSEVDEKLQEEERHVAGVREKIAAQESTIRHQRSRLVEIEADIDRVRRQRVTLTAQAFAVAEELAATTQRMQEFESNLVQIKSRMQQSEAGGQVCAELLAQLQGELKEHRQSRDDFRRRQAEDENRIAVLNSQLESTASSLADLQARRVALDKRLTEAGRLYDQLELEVQQAEAARDVAQSSLDERRSRLATLTEERNQLERTVAEGRERRSASVARIHVLDDLEQRQEGLSVGIREILRRAHESPHPPWNEILGSASDLLMVSLEDAPLLEVALGERAKLIVVRRLQPLIDYVNSGVVPISGRVGFLSVEGGTWQSTGEIAQHGQPIGSGFGAHGTSSPVATGHRSGPNLNGLSGVIACADTLAESIAEAEGLSTLLLGDTWIVRSLKVATTLSKQFPGCRFVTQQGELFEANGAFFAGTVPTETALVTRRSELQQLKHSIIRLDRDIETAANRLEQRVEEIQVVNRELVDVETEVQRVGEAVARQRSRLEGQETELRGLHEQADELNSEIERRESQRQEYEATRASIQQQQEERRVHHGQVDGIIEGIESRIGDVGQQMNTLQGEIKQQQLELATHEERVVGLRNSLQRLTTDQRQRVAQREEADGRLRELLDSRERAVLVILQTQSELASRTLKSESLGQTVRLLSQEKRDLRARWSGLTKEEEQLHKRRRAAQDAQHQADLSLREMRHQIAGLEEKINEEFQVSLRDVVRDGASAFYEYLQEKYPESLFTPGERDDVDTAEEATLLDTDAIDASASHDDAESNSDELTDESFIDDGEEYELPDTEMSDEQSLDGDAFAEAEVAVEEEQPMRSAVSDEAAARDRELFRRLYECGPVQFAEVRPEIDEQVNRLRRKLKLMGNVNTEALESLDDLESRHSHLHSQLLDLNEAKSTLDEIIRRINSESERLFIETFNTIRTHFQELFRKLFGGGEGDIILEDQNDVLECGIEIVARPPGKELRSISLLSGGEKTMTAVGLLFAMFKSKPSPYCILDEVDAALDEANVDRYAAVLKEFAEMTQFVVITHRKRTMTVADVLYGVTMEQAGISKRMAVRFDDVSDNGEIRKKPAAA